MARPYPPPLLAVPTVQPVAFDRPDQRRIARTLGLPDLPPDLAAGIAHAVGCHLTALRCSGASVAATVAALAQLSRSGCAFDAAVAHFADDRYGVDYITLNRLQPLARAVMNGDADTPSALKAAALARADELGRHPRVAPDTEALRQFCGILREVFKTSASPGVDRTLRNCRQFVLEVIACAGIETADFDAHPERLDEYMRTDVSIG
jgi:hypothetical protein